MVALVALNAKCWKDAVTAIMNKLQEADLGEYSYEEVSAMLSAFKNQHGPIEKYICSDFGIKAMY